MASSTKIFTITILLATASTISASFAPAPLAVPAPIAYTRAIPYNVPPFAASVSTFSRALAAPALLPAPVAAPAPLAYAAPAPFAYAGPAAAPLLPAAAPAPFLPAPFAAAPAPFLPAPYAAAPAPYLPAPAVFPAARSIHPYAPAFRAAPVLAPFFKK